jgi:hypothetical protein
MNYSIYSADRATHLRIVVIALVASIGVAGLGIAAHLSVVDRYSRTARTARIVRAGQPSIQAGRLPSRCLHEKAFCAA